MLAFLCALAHVHICVDFKVAKIFGFSLSLWTNFPSQNTLSGASLVLFQHVVDYSRPAPRHLFFFQSLVFFSSIPYLWNEIVHVNPSCKQAYTLDRLTRASYLSIVARRVLWEGGKRGREMTFSSLLPSQHTILLQRAL